MESISKFEKEEKQRRSLKGVCVWVIEHAASFEATPLEATNKFDWP